MNTPTADPSPWYQHFWPWFIVVLLGVSVIASLYTVSLAYRLGEIEIPVQERVSVPERSSMDGAGSAPRPTER